ncbi:hypothetical protein PENSPDRAFT_646421 [Peniophora sp. CONT]|nr:hypothetical protein PENSPDRAFT_646421 [Peniophora sp. CONT]
MHFTLLELPEEILLNVLLISSLHDILRCSQACKRLRALVVASVAVQHRIQLGRCGMVEGSGALALQKSSNQRSELLRDKIDKRRKFEPTFIHDLGTVSAESEQAFDLLDGIYARLTLEPLDHSAPDEDDFVARLIIRDISGSCREPPQITQLDIIPTDVAIAPLHDLVVLLTPEPEASTGGTFLRLDLRTLSSGGAEKHPDAKTPILRFLNKTPAGVRLPQESHLSIDGDIVAVYVCDCTLQLFRWTNGQHIVSWECETDDGETFIGAFSLISPTCFVVGYTEQGVGRLAVYHLPQEDTLGEGKQVQKQDLHIELSLPRVREDQFTMVARLGISPRRSQKGVFEAAFRIAILQVAVEAAAQDDDYDHTQDFTFVLREDLFTRVWDEHIHKSSQSRAVVVDWDHWGPQNSCLFQIPLEMLPDNSICSGSRLIQRRTNDFDSVFAEDNEIDMAYSFLCADFGDVHDKVFHEAVRAREVPSGPFVRDVLVCNEEELCHDIRTSLPYYAVLTRRDTFNWVNVLVDGDRMICSRPVASSDPENDGRYIEHVYEL